MASESKTALITGASSGIGAEFARRLAADGYDLVLVARRRDKLEALASELREKHDAVAEILVADLANAGDVDRIEHLIAGRPSMAMVVNNAGFGTVGHFHDVDLAKHLDMIQVHVTASVRFTHAAINTMLKRRRGAVINVSSMAAYLAMPNAVTYCATKMYLVTFCQGLAKELEGSGVQVQVLCPGFTYTEFHDTPEFKNFNRDDVSKGLWMKAEDVVSESMRALADGTVVCIPGRKNRAMMALNRSIIGPLLVRLLAKKRWEDKK